MSHWRARLRRSVIEPTRLALSRSRPGGRSALALRDFRPRPGLVTKQTRVERPRFRVVDAHAHVFGHFGRWDDRPVSELLVLLDEVDVGCLVSLDGGWGEDILDRQLKRLKEPAPDRFAIFGGVDWSRWPDEGNAFGERAADRLEAQVRRGAQGLKIWKPFGLEVRDPEGRIAAVDDQRLDAIWARAGALGIPVLIHAGDPVAFFDPFDETNERYEELERHAAWRFHGGGSPAFADVIEQFARLVERHRQTTFIGAHVGCYAENLAWVSSLLNRCPNLFVDIGARVAELGRQPYAARRFFIEHADRILFGTDAPLEAETYRLFYRFLETDDEYFPYSTRSVPPQGRWNVYGLHLPEDVLKRVYSGNAVRVLRLPPLSGGA